MSEPLLKIEGLGKRFGGFVALDSVDLNVAPGERLGLIGPNGSGKSTLVNCICGTLRNEDGTVSFGGARIDGLIAHRLGREAKVAGALSRVGHDSLDALVPLVYDDVDPALYPVARLSLWAHLLKLQRDGRAQEAAGEWRWLAG